MNVSAARLRRKLRKQTMTEINVVNLVDVMLTLLIIFILVAPAIKEGIEMTLPEATTAEEVKRESVMVELDSKGALYLSNRRVSIEDLERELAARHQSNPEDGVMVRADEEVPYGEVVRVFDVIRATGIERVGILTRKVSQRELR